MNIDLHNYEAFFLDHKEGNLDPAQEKELFLYLEKYPHLKEELDSYEEFTLEMAGEDELFLNKNPLKKNEFNNETLIAFTEGVLDEKTKKEIEVLASQNSALQKEIKHYASARAQPELNVKFKNKSSLKRGGLIVSLQSNYTFLRVAAAILLLVGLFFVASILITKEDGSSRKKVVAESGQETRDKSQEPGSKKQETRDKSQETRDNQTREKNLALNQNAVKTIKKNNSALLNEEPEKQNIVTNTPVIESPEKNIQKDSVEDKPVLVQNNAPEIKSNSGSYFNYSPDKDDEADQPVTASAAPKKKSFFQRVAKVAKEVNNLGIKKVDAEESGGTNSVSIGGFVVSESTN